jgi:hypothetical protein
MLVNQRLPVLFDLWFQLWPKGNLRGLRQNRRQNPEDDRRNQTWAIVATGGLVLLQSSAELTSATRRDDAQEIESEKKDTYASEQGTDARGQN